MKKFKGSLYLLQDPFWGRVIILCPHKNGWWDDSIMEIILAADKEVPPYNALSLLPALLNMRSSRFPTTMPLKVLELSDLPLYIGMPYVSTKMAELLKNGV